MTMTHTIRKTTLAAAVALGAFAFAGPALAGPCDLEISGNDALQFDRKEMTVPASCKQFTVKLTHSGKLPAAAMGHNWVLARTADVAGIATDGIAAGLANQYVKPGDARVIAHTKIVGGGASDTVTVDASKLKAGEGYTFFCSFPGHSGPMRGTFTVGK